MSTAESSQRGGGGGRVGYWVQDAREDSPWICASIRHYTDSLAVGQQYRPVLYAVATATSFV